MSEITRKHGKPFNYFALGKSVKEGQEFLLHLKNQAEAAWSKCKSQGTLVDVTRCPICECNKLEPAFVLFSFPYSSCMNEDCRHLFVSQRVDSATMADFFANDSLYSSKNYCDPALLRVRKEQIAAPKVEFVLEQLGQKPGRWLDIGCGNGEILSAAKDRGWEVLGLELSSRDAEFGRTHFGLDILQCTLKNYCESNPDQKFDVVSFFGVLHCIDEPMQLIKQSREALKDHGAVALQVTNASSMSTKAIKTFPENPTRSPHNGLTTLHQFSERSVKKLLSQAGLAPIAVWFFGADIFELLNQWSLAVPDFSDSVLYEALIENTNELQLVFDKREQSESMLWIAKS